MNNEIDTSRVILWQYDKAHTFLSLLESREDVANMVVKDTWNKYFTDCFDLKKCSRFGLWLWGILLGISRPRVSIGGASIPVSDEVYRRILIARFYWMNATPSMLTAAKYFSLLLNCGSGSDYPERLVRITDNYDMTIYVELSWRPELEVQQILSSPDIVNHPTGVYAVVSYYSETESFGFNGYWSSADTATRVGMQITRKAYWQYYDSINAKKIIPNPPYYNAAGTVLEYDAFNNEYYYTEGDVKHICGKIVPQQEYENIYDSGDSSSRHELHIISSGQLYYFGNDGEMIVPDHVYDAAIPQAHELTRDDGPATVQYPEGPGWYYTEGAGGSGHRVYVKGQNLSNFDNSNFMDVTGYTIEEVKDFVNEINNYIERYSLSSQISKLSVTATTNDIRATINSIAELILKDSLPENASLNMMAKFVSEL